MTNHGTIRETYGTALRLGAVAPEPDDVVVDVVPRSAAAQDRSESDPNSETSSVLAPPRQLRYDLDRALDRLSPTAAWEAVDYESRYREFLETDPQARAELERCRRHLAAGGTVWLVCPGNTPEERRHRAVLAAMLREGVRADGGSRGGFS
jgi:ABC-type ATPase with predicted acetyltransferase domain